MDYGYRTRKGDAAPNHKLESNDRRYIKERRADGATYAQIAQELGVSVNTVRNYEQGVTYSGDD